MAHSMGLTVTAEGVESATQADFLRVLACDELQGYYFGKPECDGKESYWVTLDVLLPVMALAIGIRVTLAALIVLPSRHTLD